MSARLALRALAAGLLGIAAPAFAQSGPSPYTTGFRYDQSGRPTGTISPDPDGAGPLPFPAVRNSYDGAGRLVRVERGALAAWQPQAIPPANWTGFTVHQSLETRYDGAGRKLAEELWGDGAPQTITQYSYTPDGRLECSTIRMNPAAFGSLPESACMPGPEGGQGPDRITRFVYDAAGQLLQEQRAWLTSAQQNYASYGYTPNGLRSSLTDANGNRAEMSYDGYDRQRRWTFPSATTPATANPADYEEYGYDANGNRTSLRKRDGSTLLFQYDALNRLSLKLVPERTGLSPLHSRDVYYSYDLEGLQRTARFDGQSGEGIGYVYDGFGRVRTYDIEMGGVHWWQSYSWDANGNRLRVSHPDGRSFLYDYDGLDRLVGIRDGAGDVLLARFAYSDRSALAALARPASVSTFSYDAIGRLSGLSHDLAGSANDVAFAFERNPASQVTRQARSNPGSSPGQADLYAWTGAYNYQRSYAANGLNQYRSIATAGGSTLTLAYDANGNLVSDGVDAWSYDVENRLVAASGGHNAQLLYDPLGRLLQLTGAGGAITRFLYDGDALIGEYGAAGTLLRRYVHGSDAAADDPLIWFEGNARRDLHADHEGSIVAITDAAGALLAADSYDEWGIPGAGNLGRFQYTGQIWLSELGMYHYKARLYSPTLGRFLQVDPAGYDDQVNLYAYVGNDPVNAADPDGRTPAAVGGGIILCISNAWCRGSAIAVGAWVASRIFFPQPFITPATPPPAPSPILQENKGNPPSRASGRRPQAEQGCIYCVPGTRTPTRRPYIGRSDQWDERQRDSRDGRDRRGAEQVGSYPHGDREAGRNAEQAEINRRGGPANLDNRRNEVAPKRWPERGIQPPRRSDDSF